MKRFYIILVGLAFVVLIYAVIQAYIDWPVDGKWADSGLKGDFWGGHFSAAGSISAAFLFFVAILMQRDAILLQKDELKAQRDELKLTREEMQSARKVYEAQEKHMAAQSKIAIHSSFASQLIDICRLRNELIVQYHLAKNPQQRRAIRKRLPTSVPLVSHLLNRPEWSTVERANFAILAGASIENTGKSCDSVKDDWFLIPESEDPI